MWSAALVLALALGLAAAAGSPGLSKANAQPLATAASCHELTFPLFTIDEVTTRRGRGDALMELTLPCFRAGTLFIDGSGSPPRGESRASTQIARVALDIPSHDTRTIIWRFRIAPAPGRRGRGLRHRLKRKGRAKVRVRVRFVLEERIHGMRVQSETRKTVRLVKKRKKIRPKTHR